MDLLEMPPEIIASIGLYMDDESWLFFRMTCHSVNNLFSLQVEKRWLSNRASAEKELKNASAIWFDLYSKIKGFLEKEGSTNKTPYLDCFSRVFHLQRQTPIEFATHQALRRCISYQKPPENIKNLRTLFRYVSANHEPWL